MMLLRFLDSTLHRQLNRLVWIWLVAAPLMVALALPADADEPTLPILSSEVELQVTGMLVHGRTVQTFINSTGRVMEAVYRFPLPERAAVHAMEMRIGSRRIVSEVREKEQAVRVYQAAKAQGRKAARVDQDRPNLFTTSAANINPGETVKVVLEYLQELDWEDGRFRLVYPLTFMPRYGEPEPQGGEAVAMEGSSAASVKMTVRIDAGLPLRTVESRSHDVAARREMDVWVIESPAGGFEGDRDFILEWAPGTGGLPGMASFVEHRDDGSYGMLMIVPPDQPGPGGAGIPTETLFIVDISGSMDGPSIAAARRSLAAFLRELDPGDRFRILLFNDGIRWLVPDLVYAEAGTVNRVVSQVGRLQATGGTEIETALMEGLRTVSGDPGSGHRRIILLTDGAVANEDQVFRAVRAGLGDTRLHVLGIGAAPNRYLMTKMARFGKGLCSFIPDSGVSESRIRRFLERLARPVLTDLHLEWPGTAEAVFPAILPDLYLGEPLYISVQLPADRDLQQEPVLAGNLAGLPVQLQAARGAGPATGVGVRWARARIAELMDLRYRGVDEATVRSQVVDLALSFGLVSRYTSMVAVEAFSSSSGEAETCAVRNLAPAGSRVGMFLGQGGTWRPAVRLAGLLTLLAGALILVIRRTV